MSFQGKVVIITGSSSGIGQECALLFAQGGASLTIHGQSEQRLQETADLLRKNGIEDSRVHSILGSVEKEEVQKRLIEETVRKFGKIDVLVNNAAASHLTELDPNSLENLDYVMKVNVNSVISLTRLAIPELEKTKGNVVNVSSVAAQRASNHIMTYSLSKAAMNHFTKNAAVLYAPKGIRINTVSPGVTLTNFTLRHDSDLEAFNKRVEHYSKHIIPIGRFGNAIEIANVIEFIASDKASYVTGSNIAVDGGMLAGTPIPKDN